MARRGKRHDLLRRPRQAGDTVTITFGDRAENNVGMQQLGQAAAAGFTYEELVRAKWRFEALGCRCELVNLISGGGVELLGGERGPEPAYLLIVRGGVGELLKAGAGARPWAGGDGGTAGDGATAGEGADTAGDGATAREGADTADEAAGEAGAPILEDLLYAEQKGLDPDKQALFRGVVKNKNARWNLCFADAPQEPDIAAGRGRVVSFAEVALTKAARDALPLFFGDKTRGLPAEGNYYYDLKKCGIRFHGDSERKIVVGLRLGASMPFHFQWFSRWKAEGQRVARVLDHGDLYAMSEKAVGADWKHPSIPTLRHAAGAPRYLTVKK